jgi:hypothetical protein
VGHLRRLLQLLVFLAFAAAALIDTTQWLKAWAVWPRILGAIGVLYLTHRYTRRHFKHDIEASHHHSVLNPVPPERASELQQEVASSASITFAQADVFARAVVEASELQKRIVEQYQPGRRTIQQTVTVDVQIPASAMRRTTSQAGTDAPNEDASASSSRDGWSFYFPVVIPPKGVLYDNLKVYAADGSELSTLTYREYLSIAVNVLHMLLSAACYSRPDNFPPDVADCELSAILGIIGRIDSRLPHDRTAGSDGAAPEPNGKTLARAVRELDIASWGTGSDGHFDPEQNERRRRALRLAASLVRVLTSHYAIVVELRPPQSGRFTVRYEYTLIPELDLSTRPEDASVLKPHNRFVTAMRTWRGLLEVLLGTRPVSIKVSLDNAWTCQSYHVIVRCPDDLYVSKQDVLWPSSGYLGRQARNAPTTPHVRFRRRLGQSYAHFYGRYLPEPRTMVIGSGDSARRQRERSPKLLLDFAEVPPGSLSRAALAAIAAVFLVWTIGYGVTHIHDGVLNTDVPALLLAFPGVVAGWLGFESVTHRLFEGPLTARLSLACTTVASLLATGLYLLRREPQASSARAGTGSRLPNGAFKVHVLGITDWRWMLLVVVLLFNASYLSYRWGINVWRFRYLGARPDPAGLGAAAHNDPEEASSRGVVHTVRTGEEV